MICTKCQETVDPSSRFCSVCGQPLVRYSPPMRSERLFRPREGRMIAGVCAGFAERYGWDVALIRLVLVLGLIFGAGTPLLAYLIAWIVMPNGQFSLPAQAGFPGQWQPASQAGYQPGPQAAVPATRTVTGTGPGSMGV